MINNDQNQWPYKERRKSKLARGVAVLPSLLTASSMSLGFYAIIFTLNEVLEMHSNFKPAFFAIIAATFFDSLDGRVARMTKTESAFGEHFDSIADMVSFGVAPAILVYCAGLQKLGRIGWLASFLYLACAAIRLARFNVLAAEQPTSRKYFKGLSSPVSAGGLGAFLIVFSQIASGRFFLVGLCCVTVLIALLMVSNVRFRSFKDLNFKRYPIQYFMAAFGVIGFIVTYHEIAFLVLFLIYLMSGLIEEIILFKRRRKSDPSVPFLPFGDRDETTPKQ